MRKKKDCTEAIRINENVREVFSAAFSPPSDLTVDQWVEQNIILPEQTSAEPGPLKISRTPYTRGILRAFGALNIEHIVLVSGRQIGKTQGILLPCMSYAIAEDPGPALFVISTGALARYTSTNRIQPQFLLCEAVRKKLTSDPDDFTNFEMKFQNMVLSIVGGQSLSQMISRPVRYLFRDEIDEIVGNISSNADPLKAVEETTTAFSNRKIIDTSTPTTTTGNIWHQLGTCQYVFEYHVPCPYCGKYQILLWERIKFDTEEKDREKIASGTYYECKYCKAEIKEIQKADMVMQGKWQARLSESPAKDIVDYKDIDIENTIALEDVISDFSVRKIGFHLPKWYGLFYNTTWGNAAKEYLEAVDANREYGDFKRLRDWSQYWAARPWVEKAEVKAVSDLLQNKIDVPALIAPKGTIALTCGIDAGADGFWFVVLAWKADMSCHLVHYGFLAGWDSLTSLLWQTSYEIESNDAEDIKRIGIYRLGIDTGGTKYENETALTMTEACYEWLRRNGRGRAFGIKGASHQIRGGKKMQVSVIDKTPSGKKIPGGLTNWLIDTDAFKDALHYRLSLPEDHAGRFSFNKDIGTDYIQHLLAEEKRLDRKTGKFEWVRVSKRNHLLDATIYGMAVADPECYGGVKIYNALHNQQQQGKSNKEQQAIRPNKNFVSSVRKTRGSFVSRVT